MNNRLQQFLSLENLTPSALADKLGVQRSGLSHILSGRNKPGYDFIKKILTNFPEINSEWLLLGKGKPYKDRNEKIPPTNLNFNEEKNKNFNSNTILFDNQLLNNKSLNNQQLDNQQLNNELLNSKQSNNQSLNEQQFNDKQSNNQSLNNQQYNSILSETKQYNSVSFEEQPFLNNNFNNSPISNTETESQNQVQSTANEDIIAKYGSQYPNENAINQNQRENYSKKRSVKRVIIYYSDGSFEELFPLMR